MMRPVIAFECKFDPESSIRPQITWQECHADGSYTDILETTEPVNDGPQRDIFKHYFFQSGYTGYFQILDHNNESAYDGTRYRCKASSTLPDDSAAVFSDCATVTFHSASTYTSGKHCTMNACVNIHYRYIGTQYPVHACL